MFLIPNSTNARLLLGGIPWVRVAGGFSPLSLFAGGAEGAWFDPSDISTLFQDSAGTTPVTASGQPVGLMLDKSQNLDLGPELVAGTWGSGVSWTSDGFTVTGTNTDRTISLTTGTTISGKFVKVVVRITNVTSGTVRVVVGGVFPTIDFQSSNGTYTAYVLAGNNDVAVDAGISFNGSVEIVSIRELAGSHATQATSSKRPTYTEGSGLAWLAFDGVDDAMATAAIDFTGTDEMSVFVGVRKATDAVVQVFYELSANTNSNEGSFLSAPGYSGSGSAVGPFWNVATKGTIFNNIKTSAAFPAPQTVVQSHLMDISGNTMTLRINGTQEARSTEDLGVGNFGNYPLFVGARSGSSLEFEGNVYGLVIPGKMASTAEVLSAESYIAAKSGVTL